MIDDQKMMRLLDHRMQSVATLRWAFDLRSSWTEAPSITVYIDGKLTVEGNLDAITNPMLEVGLVHCRALLEFLGLCDSKGSIRQIKKRHKTDVGVEHFHNAAGPLKKVEPEVALSRYEGGRTEAEKALVSRTRSSQHRVVFCRDIVTTEALDGSKDVIGGFGPSERFGIGVVSVDERGDVRPEGGYAAIDAAPDLLIGEEREEALDLVEP